MASPPPSDPYLALGVPKNASPTLIKSTYRKLVLKCHPDKVADESLKAEKADEFHKIQQAYEILSDDERRQRYDAQVRLAELRREALERRGSGARAAQYDDGAGATPVRSYEERRPSHAYDDDGYFGESRASARKYEGYEPSAKRSSQRGARTSDRTARSDRRRTRERDTRRDRDGKYATVEDVDESDERVRYEESYRKRDEEERSRDKYADENRRHASRRDDDAYDDRERKIISQYSIARDYIERAKNVNADVEPRPHVSRSSPSQYYEVRRSSESRPSTVRRSSARPKESAHDSHHRSSGRERRSVPEIVEPSSERRERASKSATASPVEVKSPLRTTIQRAHTMGTDHEHRQEAPPQPTMRRAESMPIGGGSPPTSTRRRESQPVHSSKLRHAESAMHDSGYSSPGTPEMGHESSPTRHGSTSVKYYYSSSGGDKVVPSAADDSYEYANGHRTVVHEPQQRHRPRSPSPQQRVRDRPEGRTHSSASVTAAAASAAASGVRYTTTSYAYSPKHPTVPAPVSASASSPSPSRPSFPHSSSSRTSPHVGRSDREHKLLFGEMLQSPSTIPFEDVKWGKTYGPEDVTYASGYSRRTGADREAHRPNIPRGATFVY